MKLRNLIAHCQWSSQLWTWYGLPPCPQLLKMCQLQEEWAFSRTHNWRLFVASGPLVQCTEGWRGAKPIRSSRSAGRTATANQLCKRISSVLTEASHQITDSSWQAKQGAASGPGWTRPWISSRQRGCHFSFLCVSWQVCHPSHGQAAFSDNFELEERARAWYKEILAIEVRSSVWLVPMYRFADLWLRCSRLLTVLKARGRPMLAF